MAKAQWFTAKEWLEELIDSDGPEAHQDTIDVFKEITALLGASNLEFAFDTEFTDLQEADEFVEQFRQGTQIASSSLESGFNCDYDIYQDSHGKRSMIVYEEGTGITVYRDKQ